MGLSGSWKQSLARIPQAGSPTSPPVAFAVPLGLCLVQVQYLAPIGAMTVLVGDGLLGRQWRRAAVAAAITAVAVAGAGLPVAAAGLPTTTPDAPQIAFLVAAAVAAHGIMRRSVGVDSMAAAGTAVAFAVLTLKAADTREVAWALLALVPLCAQGLDTGTLLTRESALNTTQRVLGLPHLVATRRTAAADLVPLADDLRRTLHVDRLLLHMRLPAGAAWVEATAMRGAVELDRPPEPPPPPSGLAPGPLRLPRPELPGGWRAGLVVGLGATNGRDAGYLMFGWTRWTGSYWASRMSRGVLGEAVINTARALGAFCANVWAAHTLDRERSRLGTVIDHSDVGVLALDPADRIVIWNAAMAELVGVPNGRTIGERVDKVFSLTDEDGSALSLAAGLHGNARLSTSTGRSLWVQVSSAPAGASGLVSAVFMDQSAQRELDHMRHLLLNSVRHELYGPLTTIRGHAQLLDTLPHDESAAESLEAILDAVEILHQVTDDLALMAGATPDAAPATTTVPIDVRPLLRRTLLSVPAVAARTVVTPAPDLTMQGDPVRLRQCLLAVLDNADKYAPGNSITMSTSTRGRYGVISVADEGPGIPSDERRLVLKPYYRLAEARDRPGSGMGLHITDVMMTAMRGAIELRAAPSGGLRVDLLLPLANPRE